MTPIDHLDKIILTELLMDGRKSFADIAKKNNVSKEVVTIRYKKMKEQGIIVGASIQLNYRKLGYAGVGFLSINILPQNKKSLVNYLEKLQNIWGVLPGSKFNVSAITILRSLDEMNQLKELIRKQSTVIDIESYLWLEIYHHPEKIFSEYAPKMVFESADNAAKEESMDALDLNLISRLSEDSRQPFSKLAKELGTTTTTVIKRYERLKNNKVLKAVIQLDSNKIGVTTSAIFDLKLIGPQNENIIHEIMSIPNAIQIIKTSGKFDINVFTVLKSLEDFLLLKERLEAIENVQIVSTEIVRHPGVFPGYCTYI